MITENTKQNIEKCKSNACLYSSGYFDTTKEPLFFGKKNILRFDIFKDKVFEDINKKMISFFWIPEEIDLTQDSNDLKIAEEQEVFILTRTIQKIEFLDSIMGRGPMLTFGQIVSIPELENAILTWDFFEGAIHARSYSTILQAVYPDPVVVFDEVHDIKELKEIAEFISKYYNDFYKNVIEYQYLTLNKKHISKEFMTKVKKSLLLLLMVVNCLEGIEFLSAFSAVWSLLEAKSLFPGVSSILKFIARDELQHLRLTQHLNKVLREDKSEGFSELWEELKPEFLEIYKEAVRLEFKWADLLYSKGSIIGMNADILKNYIKYTTNNRVRAVGLAKTLFPEITSNPIPWIEKYYNFSSTSSSQQEKETNDYKLGSIIFKDFNFKNTFNEVFSNPKRKP